VVKSSNVKTVEEIISENNLVTESKEDVYQPITLEKTIEDSIIEFNQIIESTISNEVYPLDLEVINSKQAINTYEFRSKDALKS
jgi:hypothetical protein